MNKLIMNNLEDKVLTAVDLVAEQSEDKVTKQLVDLFKSAILKKYKDAYDIELAQGEVRKEHLDKAIDYCFSEVCFAYRQMPIAGISDDNKENEIKKLKPLLGSIKEAIKTILENNGVKVV